jgi:hypothetical protein
LAYIFGQFFIRVLVSVVFEKPLADFTTKDKASLAHLLHSSPVKKYGKIPRVAPFGNSAIRAVCIFHPSTTSNANQNHNLKPSVPVL